MSDERQLVTLRKVDRLLPIENADFIELAVIDGWTCIVKKGEFTEGAIGVYFEIDSFLPAKDDRFAFLKKPIMHQKKLGYRIKTMKMKKVLSQGLLLPLNMFTDLKSSSKGSFAEQLGVIKYDLEKTRNSGLNTQGKTRSFPSFLRKTDQERLQNLPHYWELYKIHAFEETYKLDGSSCTMYKVTRKPTLWERIKKFFGFDSVLEEFGVCSRNVNLNRPKNGKKNNFWDMAIRYNVEQKLPLGFAISGEVIAPDIQSNHEKVSEADFYIFDVFDINKSQYLLPMERYAFIADRLSHMKHVKVSDTCIEPFMQYDSIDELQERITGESINPGTISEGRVYKSLTIPNLTFKLISNRYLLKCEE